MDSVCYSCRHLMGVLPQIVPTDNLAWTDPVEPGTMALRTTLISYEIFETHARWVFFVTVDKVSDTLVMHQAEPLISCNAFLSVRPEVRIIAVHDEERAIKVTLYPFSVNYCISV